MIDLGNLNYEVNLTAGLTESFLTLTLASPVRQVNWAQGSAYMHFPQAHIHKTLG